MDVEIKMGGKIHVRGVAGVKESNERHRRQCVAKAAEAGELDGVLGAMENSFQKNIRGQR